MTIYKVKKMSGNTRKMIKVYYSTLEKAQMIHKKIDTPFDIETFQIDNEAALCEMMNYGRIFFDPDKTIKQEPETMETLQREKWVTSIEQLKTLNQRVTVRFRGKSEGSFTASSDIAVDLIAMLQETDRYVRDIFYQIS